MSVGIFSPAVLCMITEATLSVSNPYLSFVSWHSSNKTVKDQWNVIFFFISKLDTWKDPALN